MGRVQQQGHERQLDLFDEALRAAWCHDDPGKGGTGAGTDEERQASTVGDRTRALPPQVMEEVAGSANLNQAYKRVKAHRGAPGVDGMTVADLRSWIAENRETLIGSLLDGSYRPQPVRGVEIPKPGGGMRQLGIPTVVERLVQQAILQVLEPILDPTFSDSSFGFRPGRSAYDALRQARKYVSEGYEIVVDLDLEKFFDRVNHDILMARLARRIGDKRLLGLIRRFLEADRLRQITRRNRAIPFARMIEEVNAFTTGWVTYFRHADARIKLRDLDKWLRRKLRCVRLKYCKRPTTMANFLRDCGIPEWRAWRLALSGKGWWRLAGSPQASEAMTLKWFKANGLVSLEDHFATVNATGNRRGT